MFFFCFYLQSFRGRKALNLGPVVSPRPQPPTSSNSPALAAVPQPSPNTTSTTNSNQLNIVSGGSTTPVTSQQQLITGATTVHTMKDQPQQPMVRF